MNQSNDLTQAVLLALYRRAHSYDIEFTASGFWQGKLLSAFELKDGYAVLCEQAPDDSDRSRIDQIVYRLTSNGLLAQLCMVEGKRRGSGSKHIKEAENQARLGALKNLEKTGNDVVYAMTYWLTHFRVWMVTSAGRLEPMDGGTDAPGDRSSYLDISIPEHSAAFDYFVETIKGSGQEGPQSAAEQAPELPGEQQHYAMAGPSHNEMATDEQSGGFVGPVVEEYAEEYEEYAEENAEEYADEGAGGSSTGASRPKPWVLVKVTLERHLLSSDLWVFRAKGKEGKEHKVPKDDWKQSEYDNKKVWVYRGKKTTYYTLHKPS